jgi:hypothetical protein
MVLRAFDIHQFLSHSFALSLYLRAAEQADPAVRRAMIERAGAVRPQIEALIGSRTPLGSFCDEHGFTADDLDVIRIALESVSRDVGLETYKDMSLFRSYERLLPHEVVGRLSQLRIVTGGYVTITDPFVPHSKEEMGGLSIVDLIGSAQRSEEPASFGFAVQPYPSFEALSLDLRVLQRLVSFCAEQTSGPPVFEALIDAFSAAVREGYGVLGDEPYARFLTDERVSYEELIVLFTASLTRMNIISFGRFSEEHLLERYSTSEEKRSLIERGLVKSEYDTLTLTERSSRVLIGSQESALIRPTETFETVCLPAGTLERIRQVIGQVRSSSRIFDEWGLRVGYGRGVTMNLTGPPGTGKTLTARAIAHELDKPLIMVKISEIMSMWLGEMEKNIVRAFEEAREKDAVLFFDEADALTTSRERATHEWEISRTNTLLKELECFEGVCIFATNFASAYDSAFNRRLSAHIAFSLPDEAMLARIFSIIAPDSACGDDVDFSCFAGRYAGVFSGGDVKNVVLGAARIAAHEGSERIGQSHFERACLEVYSGKGIEEEPPRGEYIG